jgi:hypothetical protein
MGKSVKKKQEKQYLKDLVATKELYDKRMKYRVPPKPVTKKLSTDELINLSDVSDYSDRFLRDPEKFKTKGFNKERQVREFIRYVFCKYPVPEFMFSCWKHLDNNWKDLKNIDYREWFLYVVQGGSLYKKYFKDLGFTKQETHIFLSLRSAKSYAEAMWISIIIALNGNDKNIKQIVRSGQFDYWAFTPFWRSVARFFVVNQVDDTTFHELCDYIKDEHRRHEDFSLKGRTLASITDLSNEWHVRMSEFSSENWKAEWQRRIGDDIFERKVKIGKDNYTEVWYFEEIVSGKALALEGRQMKHCVASYIGSCQRGDSIIFRVSCEKFGFHSKKVTIEVRGNSIVQIRGVCNSRPDGETKAVVQKWAVAHGLTISRYCLL